MLIDQKISEMQSEILLIEAYLRGIMQKTQSNTQWATLIGSSLSCFVAYIDFAIVNTALPAIQQDLSASVLQLQWMMNAFVLAVSVLMVTMGRLADLFGRRLLNIIGVFIFGIFSLFAGLAFDPNWLIFCRVMQGIATAIIIPSSLALISHAFPESQKGRAIGIWSSITGVGLAIGPVLGGFIVSALNWRWIFYINIPFAVAALIITFLFIKESSDEKASKKIDILGLSLITIGITSLVIALIQAPNWGWDSPIIFILFALSIITLIMFYLREVKSSNPMVPFHLFRNNTFLSCSIALFSMVFFSWSAFFLMPLYLQNIRNELPYIVGLMLLPVTACVALFSPIVGHWVDTISSKLLMLIGLCFLVISALMQAYFNANSSYLFVLVSFTFMGLAWAFVSNPATTKGINSVPHSLAGTATGVLWTVQNIGGAIGLALAGTIFRHIYQKDSSDQSFNTGYHGAMWLLFGVSLLTFFVLMFTMRKDEKSTS